MEASTTTTAIAVRPLFSSEEQHALFGFLAGYSGLTREAYALDLRHTDRVRRHSGALPARMHRAHRRSALLPEPCGYLTTRPDPPFGTRPGAPDRAICRRDHAPSHARVAEIVALLVRAADEDADLSMVKVVRDGDRRVVTFETRTPRAFVGPGRTRATALRDALAERLGDPRLQLQVSYPPPHDDEAMR